MQYTPADLRHMRRLAAFDRAMGALKRLALATCLAGHAAFDAALLRELAAPQGAPPAYFRDVAGKWRKAARLIQDDKAKAFAEDRASAMDALAQNIAQPGND